MDSLTQITLGATLAAAIAPAGQRRRALLYGAALGTLPDLDVLVRHADPVANFTYHRSYSHSLPVLALLAPLLWLLLRRLDGAVRQAPGRWLALIWLVLLTHPLLDAMTIYGTQLWWPFDPTPLGVGSIFIIDPLYTLPLLLASLWALSRPTDPRLRRVLPLALIVSSAYLGWSAWAQQRVSALAQQALAAEGLQSPQVLALPSPFNTLLWRILVREPDGYREAYYSLLSDEQPGPWRRFASADGMLAGLSGHWPVERLRWFTHGYYAARVEGEDLIVTDLRMGSEPAYVFSFRVGRIASDGSAQAAPTRQQPTLRPPPQVLQWLLARMVTPGHAMASADEVMTAPAAAAPPSASAPTSISQPP